MSKKQHDEPRCDHMPGFVHMVTNQPQEVYDKSRGLRSVWVCGERACVLDAMAWVERGTGEVATVRPPLEEASA